MTKFAVQRDSFAGGLFMLLGIFGLLIGNASSQSARSFPQLLAASLVLTGLALVIRGLVRRREMFVNDIPWRAISAIIGGVILFALLIESAGLIPASMVTAVAVAAGFRALQWGAVLVFALCLALATAVLFVELLDQPVKLGPGL